MEANSKDPNNNNNNNNSNNNNNNNNNNGGPANDGSMQTDVPRPVPVAAVHWVIESRHVWRAGAGPVSAIHGVLALVDAHLCVRACKHKRQLLACTEREGEPLPTAPGATHTTLHCGSRSKLKCAPSHAAPAQPGSCLPQPREGAVEL